MEKQLYLFTGDNTYTLNHEISRWKHAFLAKHGEANLSCISAKDCVWRELIDEISACPFLGERRLIILDGIPSGADKTEWEHLLKIIHPQTILAIVEEKLDKRKSATKILLKQAEIKECAMLPRKQLIEWLLTLSQEHGALLTRKVAEYLLDRVGNDQWHLKNECLKLFAFTETSPSTQDVDNICLPSAKHTVWRLSDLVGSQQTLEAVRFSRALHENGEDAMRLWNLLLWMTGNLAAIWIHAQKTQGGIAQLAKATKIPFPSVQALMPLAHSLNESQICTIVDKLIEADHALKTGELKSTSADSIEAITLLERSLLRLS